MTAAALVRLRADVRAVARAGGQVLLVPASRDARPVRLSPAAVGVLPLLHRGANRAAIAAELRMQFPAAPDIDGKLASLLDQLGSTGLLVGTAAPEPRRLALPNPDPLARRIASGLRHVPRSLLIGVVAALAAAALAGVIALLAHGLPFTTLMRDFQPVALAWFVLIHVPAHELGHAIASRYLGVPVAGAGLQRHFVLPTPFIETPLAYTLTGRGERWLVAAAGPLIDLVAAGTASWLALAYDGAPIADIARWLSVLLVLSLLFNLNPLRATDGSRMAEAVLDDDLARRSALSRAPGRLSSPLTVIRYRALVVAHLLVFAGVVTAMAVAS